MSHVPPQKKLKQSNIMEYVAKDYKDKSSSSVLKSNTCLSDEPKLSIEKKTESEDLHKSISANDEQEYCSEVCEPKDSKNLNLLETDANKLSNSDSCNACDVLPDDNTNDGLGQKENSFSDDLFDSFDDSFSIENMHDFKKSPFNAPKLLKFENTAQHTILIHLQTDVNHVPNPYYDEYLDRWDDAHVKMPCSSNNVYVIEDAVKQRWDIIRNALQSKITSSHDLEDAILSYNTRYKGKWSFEVLHTYFYETLTAEMCTNFFQNIFPKMCLLALELPSICTRPIPLLKCNVSHSITFSQKQIACLLCNAFFCTFPRRNAKQKNSEFSSFPDINFNRLFSGKNFQRNIEKLKCLFHYFERVVNNMPTGTITFQRKVMTKLPNWTTCEEKLCNIYVSSEGNIEDDGEGMLQVDFANKFIGGGVLGKGLVQEEIRFVICPELIISRLITEVLNRNECLIITGSERFSNYTGYASTFKWNGNYTDTIEYDEWGRKYTEIVAIDASVCSSHSKQFEETNLNRELNKAYCGFHSFIEDKEKLTAVATGNWGCGAFGGYSRLKAFIQIIASSKAGRDLCYWTFGDNDLKNDLLKLHNELKGKGIHINSLYSLLVRYGRLIKSTKTKINLFEYIRNEITEFYLA